MSDPIVVKITGGAGLAPVDLEIEIPLRPLAVFIAGISSAANCMHEPTIFKIMDMLKGSRNAPR